jgi:hypothetical protein
MGQKLYIMAQMVGKTVSVIVVIIMQKMIHITFIEDGIYAMSLVIK